MEEDLIPGLPDDIARQCLIRLPFNLFSTAHSVCKLWQHELQSSLFHCTRKSANQTRPVIALVQSTNNKKTTPSSCSPTYKLTLLDPSTATWHSLPSIGSIPLFCQIAAVGQDLVLIGGWDPQTWTATDEVHVYNFVSSTWRRGTRMPGPCRSFFACASSDAAIVVAGGHDEKKDALKSAFMYDVANDEWVPLPDMAKERDECKGVFLRGKFHVVGGYSTDMQGGFTSCAEEFDVATWKWGPVEEDVLLSATCPRTCVAGGDDLDRLYMCENRHVAVSEGDAWRKVVKLPDEVRVALQMVEWEGRLVIMGSGVHGGVLVCYVLEEEMTWREVEVPVEYSGHVQAACYLEI